MQKKKLSEIELNTTLIGDCRETLKQLPDGCINTCITSPPFYALRDYQEENQIGLEKTPDEYVEELVKVFREVKRVLREDGTLWLNLGDTYSSHKDCKSISQTLSLDTGSEQAHVIDKGRSASRDSKMLKEQGLKNKELIGIPWKVAFALREDGWYLRQDIIWSKKNSMPESVKDRCTKSHEYIFLMTKNPTYYYDNEAIKEDSIYAPNKTKEVERKKGYYAGKWSNPEKGSRHDGSFKAIREKKNKRSVWTVATRPFKDAHFAVFPPDLIEPMVLAGCPEKVCVECDMPYERKVESKRLKRNELSRDDPRYRPNTYEGSYKDINGKADAGYTETKDLGLQKQCQCKTNEVKKGIVLDPFMGSGTTGMVAQSLGRSWIGCELNPEYVEMQRKRTSQQSLF